jgi:hypothetical protein
LVPNASRSAHSTGLKTGSFDGRPFRIVAGPELSPTALRLAALPLHPELATRLARLHAPLLAKAKARRKAARMRVALIKKRTLPVNILGGYRFPGAPQIDLNPIDAPAWAAPSRWKPIGTGIDVPPIPNFLLRKPISTSTSGAARAPPNSISHHMISAVNPVALFVGEKSMTHLELVNHCAACMRAGAALHLTYGSQTPWTLSNGMAVTNAVARVLVASPNVVGVGDTLFGEGPSQTFRWVEPTCCGS